MEEFNHLNGNSEGGGEFLKNDVWKDPGEKQERVDFILVWNSEDQPLLSDEIEIHQNRISRRNTFETNLRNEGLILETEKAPDGCAQGMNFVKITAPSEVLERYAEILKLRLPMKKVSFVT